MAGLYIHIPFCKSRCLYCDFFSTTLLKRQEAYISAVCQEISQRLSELQEPIETVYIGGGTPSTLPISYLTRIASVLHPFRFREVTMELNPGDATEEYVRALREIGINRLSIGIQSFQEKLLRLIGRRHNAAQAIEAVQMAQKAGFDNISIDLMYALPTQTMAQWKADIETAINLHVQHISSYGLMYKEGTAITQMLNNGEIEAIDEDLENDMYDFLCERLQQAGFSHYEVSNFALPGYESQHNSSYWNGTPYLGVGAGAHSYIGNVRSWNPNDLEAYIRGIENGKLVRESETLTDEDRYNEHIMLALRTRQGIPRTDIKADIDHFLEAEVLRETKDGHIVATQQGLHILNVIIEELMI